MREHWSFDAEHGTIRSAEGWALACVPHTIAGDEQDLANGQLMSLAPELLEALEVLVDHAQERYPHFESERGQRDIAQALAVIAKAKSVQ